MKMITLIILLTFISLTKCFASSYDPYYNDSNSKLGYIIRFSGGMGWNIGSHYRGQGGDGTDYLNFQWLPGIRDPENIPFIGLDITYLKTLSPVINGIGTKNRYIGTGLFIEISMPERNIPLGPFFQLGIDFYSPIGDNKKVEIGLMINYGITISLTPTIEMPISARFDILSGRNIAVNGTAGLSFKFNFLNSIRYEDSPLGPSNY